MLAEGGAESRFDPADDGGESLTDVVETGRDFFGDLIGEPFAELWAEPPPSDTTAKARKITPNERTNGKINFTFDVLGLVVVLFVFIHDRIWSDYAHNVTHFKPKERLSCISNEAIIIRAR